jgi:hypothetical protein
VLATPRETTWIEMQLLDLECEPVANERYRITFPDGVVREGRLNYLGRARFDDVADPGACKIAFPELDADAWDAEVKCPPSPPVVIPWVEFELVDLEGYPVAGERYRATLPDGSVHEGILGADGRIRYEGMSDGPCKIAFPDLDADAWEALDDA